MLTIVRMAQRLEERIVTDVAVIGGGSAGYSAALEAAGKGYQVDLFTKGATYKDSNSNLIAGGLAAVPLINGKPLEGDSFDLQVQNTLKAGASLNNEAVVRYCVEHFFPDVIQLLIYKRTQFH